MQKFLLTIPWQDEWDELGFRTTAGFVSADSMADAVRIAEEIYKSEGRLIDFLVGKAAYKDWPPFDEPRTLEDHGLWVGAYALTPACQVPELDVQRVLAGLVAEPTDVWHLPSSAQVPAPEAAIDGR